MTLITRDRGGELDRLSRVERVVGHDGPGGYALAVIERLDSIEAQGGPDQPATTPLQAVQGMHEEAVDGGAWGIVAATLLDDAVRAGTQDAHVAGQIDILLDDITVAFARAEQAARAALRLLGK